MWPLHGGTLGIWRSSYPARLVHLSQSQWGQFQRCHLAPIVGDRIRQWIAAPRPSWIAAPDFALGYSVHRRCRHAASPPVTRVPGIACRAPLLSGTELELGVPTGLPLPPCRPPGGLICRSGADCCTACRHVCVLGFPSCPRYRALQPMP